MHVAYRNECDFSFESSESALSYNMFTDAALSLQRDKSRLATTVRARNASLKHGGRLGDSRSGMAIPSTIGAIDAMKLDQSPDLYRFRVESLPKTRNDNDTPKSSHSTSLVRFTPPHSSPKADFANSLFIARSLQRNTSQLSVSDQDQRAFSSDGTPPFPELVHQSALAHQSLQRSLSRRSSNTPSTLTFPLQRQISARDLIPTSSLAIPPVFTSTPPSLLFESTAYQANEIAAFMNFLDYSMDHKLDAAFNKVSQPKQGLANFTNLASEAERLSKEINSTVEGSRLDAPFPASQTSQMRQRKSQSENKHEEDEELLFTMSEMDL